MPFLLHYLIGGRPDELGQDYPDFIIEAWGGTKFEACELARVVVAGINDIAAPVHIGDAWVMGGSVNLGPVPTSGTAWGKRYRIDTSFHIRSAL